MDWRCHPKLEFSSLFLKFFFSVRAANPLGLLAYCSGGGGRGRIKTVGVKKGAYFLGMAALEKKRTCTRLFLRVDRDLNTLAKGRRPKCAVYLQ